MRRSVAFFVALAVPLLACSLLVDTTGLAGDGPAALDSGDEGQGPAADAAKDAAFDAHSSTSAYRAAVLADDPVAYFRLGDPSGATSVKNEVQTSGASGSLANAPRLSVPGAIVGDLDTAIGFDTANGARLDLGTFLPRFDGLDASIELWFKRTVIPPDSARFLFDRQTPAGLSGPRYALFLLNTRIHFERVGVDGGADVLYPGISIGLGSWYHVVVTTAAGGPVSIFVNGVVVGGTTTPAVVTPADLAGSLYFGTNVASLNSDAAAAIDEIAIYSKTLSAARVLEHYRVGTTPP